MKKVFTTIAIITVCILGQLTSYASSGLTYSKAMNPFIEVSISNVSNNSYSVLNALGQLIQTGIVTNNMVLKINTKKLKKGSYQFLIDGIAMQQFNIN